MIEGGKTGKGRVVGVRERDVRERSTVAFLVAGCDIDISQRSYDAWVDAAEAVPEKLMSVASFTVD